MVSFGVMGSAAAQMPVDLLVGIKGGVAGTATSEVPKLSNRQQIQYAQPTDDSGFYPGFGIGPGVGLSLEARILGVLGLESGVYYMGDNLTGWQDKSVNSIPRGRVTMEHQVSALHVPVLLKAVAPSAGLKPFLGLGLEFVFQQSSSLEYRTERENSNDPTIDQYGPLFSERNRVSTASYMMLQLTTGVEIDLGVVRVPVELRAGYNLGWDDSFDARVKVESGGSTGHTFTSNGENMAHFGIFTGVVYDYDFLL
ncbi:hypothetical protein DN745_18060 [Bradymonas sediminis]|uniref:Outer membrane protein beta-barrel domain-containing protein n=1 Tax=Bradymonas sediminis TaxID=1548548 RepID=A0A2Z4FR76_9DELT|nr:hypothetical protein DN745_18060 [Bradymonas sediminis]